METTFVKIARYTYTAEAIIVRGKLESEGVDVFMADNFIIDTDPLVSNAVGGVKLYVKAGQREQAKLIINDISRYSVDNNGKPLQCPKCSEHKVEVGTTVKDFKSLLAFIITFGFFTVLPIYTKYKYRCDNCSHEFNIT